VNFGLSIFHNHDNHVIRYFFFCNYSAEFLLPISPEIIHFNGFLFTTWRNWSRIAAFIFQSRCIEEKFLGKMMTIRHFPLQCWHVHQTRPTEHQEILGQHIGLNFLRQFKK